MDIMDFIAIHYGTIVTAIKIKKNLIFVTYFLGNCTAFVAPSTQILFLKNILFYNKLLGDAAYLKNCEFFH